MSKQCKVCGAEVPNAAKFCQNCGSADFISFEDKETGQINQQQGRQQVPVMQQKPANKKKGAIIGIIAAVLIALAQTGLMAKNFRQIKGDGQNNGGGSGNGLNFDIDHNNDYSGLSLDREPYTKGQFYGETYINEWAGFKMNMPDGFANGDSVAYEVYEVFGRECGICWTADDTAGGIVIYFDKIDEILPDENDNMDEERYLDLCMMGLREEQLKKWPEITLETDNEYSTKIIAGYTYALAECRLNAGYGDVFQNFYVRKLDGRMIVIQTIGVSAEANDELTEIIERIN